MSGGSLNYLCYAETFELYNRISDIEECECVVSKLGYEDIAKDIRRLIEYIISAQNRISALQENLNDVFHAVEWEKSADYGKDDLIKYLEEYRSGGKTDE